METPTPEFTPPYGVPWNTVHATITKMEKEGVPNRVDRSYLGNQAGNVQTYLIAALKSFGLIVGDNAVPTEALKLLVAADEGERKERFKALLRTYYPQVVALGQTKATQGELEELFGTMWNQRGETKTKAIRFYLAAAQYAGIQISPMWKSPRAAPSSRPRRQKRQDETPPPLVDLPIQLPAADEHEIRLPSGATVTLTLSERLLKLPKDERNFVLELIDTLDARDTSGDEDDDLDEDVVG